MPISDRSYFTMCRVTGFDYHAMGANMANQMKISLYVDNELAKGAGSISIKNGIIESLRQVFFPLEKHVIYVPFREVANLSDY